MNCSPHNNPANYIDTPDEKRPGFIKSHCRVCGKFIGYRRIDGKAPRALEEQAAETESEH